VRALHFYIGDDENEISNHHGDVRAVVTEMPDEGDMQSILFRQWCRCSRFSFNVCKVRVRKLQVRLQSCMMHKEASFLLKTLMDQTGKLITLRERVAVSSQVYQPILCYMARCWKLDGESTLVSKHLFMLPE